MRRQILTGTFIHSKSREELEYLHDTVLGVDEEGKIAAIKAGHGNKEDDIEGLIEELAWARDEVEISDAGHNGFFFPGFIGELPI